MSAQGRTDAPVGWASSPEKIGWVRVSSGPEPEVRFAASDPPPESLTMGEVEASAAAKKHAAERAFQDMMNDFARQNGAESSG
jgi:hypothetical protein